MMCSRHDELSVFFCANTTVVPGCNNLWACWIILKD
ncbi:unnamed protein product, partial [Ascophyllum nodosum]